LNPFQLKYRKTPSYFTIIKSQLCYFDILAYSVMCQSESESRPLTSAFLQIYSDTEYFAIFSTQSVSLVEIPWKTKKFFLNVLTLCSMLTIWYSGLILIQFGQNVWSCTKNI